MALPSESWMQEFNAATKLADEIGSMVSDTNSLSSSDSVSKRHLSAARRKITILRAKLDTLQSLLTDLPSKQPMSDKEMNRRRDKLKILISKANQMASTLNMSIAPDRDSLFGPDKKSEDLMSKAAGLDNRGVLGLQQQIMKEQDEGLEKLEETVLSTKHIALAVNEELNLHTRLLDDLDEHVDVTNSHLQRVQRNLGILNKRMNGGCSCLMLMVIAVVILLVAAWLLIKYL